MPAMFVMPGLVPGIHVLTALPQKLPGHDENARAESLLHHFAVATPASFITFAHFSISASINPRKCSGVSPATVRP